MPKAKGMQVVVAKGMPLRPAMLVSLLERARSAAQALAQTMRP